MRKIEPSRFALFFLCISFLTMRAEAGFVGAHLDFGYGMGPLSESGHVESRNLDHLTAGGLLGIQIAGITFGPTGYYQKTRQLSDPIDYSDENFNGSGYLIGVGVSLPVWLFQVTAGFDFYGKYTQSLMTVKNQVSAFSSPLGARFIGSYHIFSWLTAGLDFKYTTFGRNILDDTWDSSLSGSRPKLWSSSLVIGVHYQ